MYQRIGGALYLIDSMLVKPASLSLALSPSLPFLCSHVYYIRFPHLSLYSEQTHAYGSPLLHLLHKDSSIRLPQGLVIKLACLFPRLCTNFLTFCLFLRQDFSYFSLASGGLCSKGDLELLILLCLHFPNARGTPLPVHAILGGESRAS